MAGSVALERDVWTIDAVEEALVDCHDLWRRSPGGGAWPFAKDGPWHLAQGEVGDVKGEYSETLLTTEAGKELLVRKVESLRPRSALRAAEVARRDAVTAWLAWLADEQDRRIVHHATERLHAGEGRVPWKAVAKWAGWSRSTDALARRYLIALATICCRLNGVPLARARAMAERFRRSDGE